MIQTGDQLVFPLIEVVVIVNDSVAQEVLKKWGGGFGPSPLFTLFFFNF